MLKGAFPYFLRFFIGVPILTPFILKIKEGSDHQPGPEGAMHRSLLNGQGGVSKSAFKLMNFPTVKFVNSSRTINACHPKRR
jgi:hypothetical protein